MLSIAYFSFPARGHINPTLPVFRELARRQCHIVYYATETFRQAVEETGAQFRSYGPQFQMPQRGPGPFARVSTTLETLLHLTDRALHHCLEETRRLSPTHILYDSFAPWGRLIAQLLDLPSMASVPSILINAEIDGQYGAPSEDPQLTPQWYAAFRSRLEACLSRYKLREFPSPPQLLQSYAEFNLVYTSHLFQPLADAFDPRRFRFVGPCLEFRPQTPQFPFERLDGRPLILISLGTVYGDRPGFLRQCLEELSGSPWQIVLAAGDHLPLDALGPIPENCIVRPSVPQLELLPRASVFLTHGGMNSVQEALYHGVPLLLAPQGADQFWISSRVAELGAGLIFDDHPQAIRLGLQTLLADPRYAAAATRIGASLRTAGGSKQAAREIAAFITCGAGPRAVAPRLPVCGPIPGVPALAAPQIRSRLY
jgi:MGT family glycosyltransferase